MKTTLCFLLILLSIGSCKIDNYQAAQSALSGKILDSQTNKLVESGGVNGGSVVQFYQNTSSQPLLFTTFPDGTFVNANFFAGNYSYTAVGPFEMVTANPVNIVINGSAEIDIKVIPNVRLTATLVSMAGTTATVKITYEKVPADQNLTKIAVVWSTFGNPNLFSFPGGNAITEDVQGLNLTTGEETFTITGLTANTVYYIRAAAITDAPGNYYNYSSQIKSQ